MKNNHRLIKVLCLLFIVSMISLAVVASLFFKSEKPVYLDHFEKTKQETFTLEDVNSIAFDLKESEVEVHTVSAKEMTVTQYETKTNSKTLFNVTKTEGTLTISDTYSRSNDCLFCKKDQVKYVIYLPKSYQQDLAMEVRTADLSFTSGVNLKNVHLTLKIGDIDIEKMVAESLTINSDLGDIEIDSFKGALTLTNNIGDVTLHHFLITGDSTIKVETGDVEVEMDEKSSCTVTAHTKTGESNINKEAIFNNGSTPFLVETNMGDIEIIKQGANNL